MHGELTQIAIIAFATLSCGLLFEKFKQPAVLGYILAGIVLSFFGLIENRENIFGLAELGIQMLLFLIGLELSLKSFKSVWHITLITALLQIAGSLAVILGLGKLFNLPFGMSLVLAFSVALSSTAVGIKMLERIDMLQTDTGKVAVGILIAQDLTIVPIILILRGLDGGTFDSAIIGKVLLSVFILMVLIWFFGRDKDIKLPFSRTIEANLDITPIAGLAFCFGCALVTGLLGLSEAYGAFLGGLILGNTTERHTMVKRTKPIQTVLMMVFFLSIGLLMDIGYILDHIWKVLTLLVFITIGKTFLNVSILHLLRLPWSQAFLAGVILAQMGEFGFLLTTVGLQTNLLDGEGSKLIISLTALSLAISPFWMATARRLHDLKNRRIQSFGQLMNSLYGREIETAAGAVRSTIKVLKNGKKAEKNEEPKDKSPSSDKTKSG